MTYPGAAVAVFPMSDEPASGHTPQPDKDEGVFVADELPERRSGR